MKSDKPIRPAEPYHWDKEHMNNDMFADWQAYVNELENYAKGLEAIIKLDSEMWAEKEDKKEEKLFSICYHEILGKTIYVRAKSREEAMSKATSYFDSNPLNYDDFLDSSMGCDEVDPRMSNVDDWEITDIPDA